MFQKMNDYLLRRMPWFFILQVMKFLWMVWSYFFTKAEFGYIYLIHVERPELRCWQRGSDIRCLTRRQFLDLKLLKIWGFLIRQVKWRLDLLNSEHWLILGSMRHWMLFHLLEKKPLELVKFWQNHGWWRWLHLHCR